VLAGVELAIGGGGHRLASLGFGPTSFLLRGNGMNAAEQVRSFELAQTVASALTLFRGHFPAARANLTPWRDDPLTRAYAETESLDLSFHFPGWSPRTQCRSVLVQLRLDQPAAGQGAGAQFAANQRSPDQAFTGQPSTGQSSPGQAAPGPTAAGAGGSPGRPRLLGVVVRGLTYESERWRLATLGDWRPSGSHLPQPEVTEKLQGFCRELFELFEGGASSAEDRQVA